MLSDGFTRVRYEHVPRERNKQADRLANVGVDEWLAGRGPPGARPTCALAVGVGTRTC